MELLHCRRSYAALVKDQCGSILLPYTVSSINRMVASCGRKIAGLFRPSSRWHCWLTGGAMSKSFAQVFLTLPLVLILVGGYSPSALATQAKQTASTQKAEDACVHKGASCSSNCDKGPFGPGRNVKECRDTCGDKMNTCLNNIKQISVQSPKQPQPAKKTPAVMEKTTPSKKGGVDVRGTRKSNLAH